MKTFLAPFVLSAFMLAPLSAQEVSIRLYDRDHKDYHNWDDRENRAYNRYLADQHRERKHEFKEESRENQRNYWRWRHEHNDQVLFPR